MTTKNDEQFIYKPIAMEIGGGCTYVAIKKKVDKSKSPLGIYKKEIELRKKKELEKENKLEKEILDLEKDIVEKTKAIRAPVESVKLDKEIEGIEQMIEKKQKEKEESAKKKKKDWNEFNQVNIGLETVYEQKKTENLNRTTQAETELQIAFQKYKEATENMNKVMEAEPILEEDLKKHTSIVSNASIEWANHRLAKQRAQDDAATIESERKFELEETEKKKNDMEIHWNTYFPAINEELTNLSDSLKEKKQLHVKAKENEGKPGAVLLEIQQMGEQLEKKKARLKKMKEDNSEKNINPNIAQSTAKNGPKRARTKNETASVTKPPLAPKKKPKFTCPTISGHYTRRGGRGGRL